MYILTIGKDKEEIKEIKNTLENILENQICLIANSKVVL